jgi:5-hydroxyisourate hydrolase
MSTVTTHVLDTVLGEPAAGLRVRLERLKGGGRIEIEKSAVSTGYVEDGPGEWIEVARSSTDADGRCRDLTLNAAPGVYRLTFDICSYLARHGRSGIYPQISITFICGDDSHYHLPLLLSDYGYTTYRGS